jgi:NDP-sugar pyrophosphorylase family protein
MIYKIYPMIKNAIILAGGKGERLRPHTDDKPKPMIPLAGRPAVENQVLQFKKAGVENIVFAVSYKREVLMHYWGDGSKWDLNIKYSEEDEPLGRGGGIKKAMEYLPGEWDNTYATNGDNLWKVDFNLFEEVHKKNEAIATMMVAKLKSPYGIVHIDDLDRIEGFVEKPILPHWLNAGVYLFSREIYDLLPDVGDMEDSTFPNLPKEKFLAFKSEGYWKGFDTIKDLSEAEKEAAEIFSDL